MRFKIEKTSTILLALAGIVFVLFYLMLGYYSRFATDDYHYIALGKQHGIWGSMMFSYHHYTGRWTSLLLLVAGLKFLTQWGTLLPFHLITITLTVVSFYYLIKNSLKRYLKSEINKLVLISYSVLLTAMFFFTSIDIGETWFWVTASVHYLWGVIIVCLGTSLILSSSNKPGIYILIILSFLFAGGANETIVFVMVLLFVISIGVILIEKKAALVKLKDDQLLFKLISGLVAITISFYITYKAPGNEVRASVLPENTLLNALWITITSSGKLILFKLPGKIPYLILFALPWLFLGNATMKNASFKPKLKALFYSSIILLLLIFCSLFPSAYMIAEIAPARALTQISFCICLFVCIWSFYIGNWLVIKESSRKLLLNVSLVLIICLMIFHIYDQLPIVSKYAQQVDDRVAYLNRMNQSGNTTLVRVEPLPSSGMLLSAEITVDSTRHPNMHLMKGLALNFYIEREQ